VSTTTSLPARAFAGGGTQRTLSLLARLALGVVLLIAGGLKVADPNQAITAVTAYRILPEDVATLVGYGLPFFEVMLGLLLLVGLATRAAAATSGVLMVVFIVAVSSAWARGLSIDCGCFGGGGQTADPQYLPEILRDLLFLGLASWLVVFPSSRWALDGSGLLGTGDLGLVDELIDESDDADGHEDQAESDRQGMTDDLTMTREDRGD
jgi:uncharacterized membrane protein YphA (DoxX/SURF4 family)